MKGRTLAIGDIHGCDAALDALLSGLKLTPEDTLIVIGDVIDRGPGSRQAVARLLQIKRRCELVFIMGNHEEMLLDALAGGPVLEAWLHYGGQEAVDSYGGRLEDIPGEHLEFFQSAVDYWETDTEIYVHASLQPDVPLAQQTREWLRWARFTGLEQPHASGKRVICGHTPQPSGLPAVIDGWICLDTWAYNGFYLSCLDVTNERLYQSNQRGDFRGGVRLSDLS